MAPKRMKLEDDAEFAEQAKKERTISATITPTNKPDDPNEQLESVAELLRTLDIEFVMLVEDKEASRYFFSRELGERTGTHTYRARSPSCRLPAPRRRLPSSWQRGRRRSRRS